jgi:hypothetical protein
MPVDELVRHVCDVVADYNNDVSGWTGGVYDPGTEILTLHFVPDDDALPAWAPTTYRFRLILDPEPQPVEPRMTLVVAGGMGLAEELHEILAVAAKAGSG